MIPQLSRAWLLAGLMILTALPWPRASAEFDAELAARLGADAYGMRTYVMVFLEAGDARIEDPERLAELQRGHMAHIRALGEQGHLVLAGPFIDAGDLRGIFLFAHDDVEEVQVLVAADPAVAAGRLQMRLQRWYGSAALLELPERHARIAARQP